MVVCKTVFSSCEQIDNNKSCSFSRRVSCVTSTDYCKMKGAKIDDEGPIITIGHINPLHEKGAGRWQAMVTVPNIGDWPPETNRCVGNTLPQSKKGGFHMQTACIFSRTNIHHF